MKHLLLALLLAGTCTQNFAQIAFADLADAAGVGEFGNNYGVSLIDFDNDGLEDIYLCRSKDVNRLYRNLGNGTFADVATSAGLSQVLNCRLSVWGDINNDGNLDVFIGTVAGGDFLFLNNGNGRFTNISKAAGMKSGVGCISACMGDIDNDGLIDLYCARLNDENTLYRNIGGNKFSDITLASGTTDTLVSMGTLFVDYDLDGDLDLYLVHDNNGPNILYQNDGKGHFTDVAPAAGVNYGGFGMGVDAGDVNHDGWPDLYVSYLYRNLLFLNNGDGTFTNIAQEALVDDNGMGWSTSFLDVDNDGWQDIYLANTPPYPNVLYRNRGNLQFEVAGSGTPVASRGNSYGMACGDLNNDGRVDILVANSNDSRGNELFINQTLNDNHWVTIHLQGTRCNRAAIGARVALKANGFWQSDVVTAGSGWSSQNSLNLHFGTGSAALVDSVVIHWPGGLVEYYENLEVDKRHDIIETTTFISDPSAWVQVVPNPFEDQFSIYLNTELPGVATFSLTELSGKIILTQALNPSESSFQIELPLPDLAPGLYLLRIDAGELSARYKMVKTH